MVSEQDSSREIENVQQNGPITASGHDEKNGFRSSVVRKAGTVNNHPQNISNADVKDRTGSKEPIPVSNISIGLVVNLHPNTWTARQRFT
jgi:hypothetical protein